LGLKADDKAGMMARLRAQGVNAANISLYDAPEQENDKKTVAPKPKNIGQIAREKKVEPSRMKLTAGSHSKGETNGMRDALRDEQTVVTGKTRGKEALVADYGVQNIIRQLKAQMKARGAHGFIGLQRKFRIMDDDGSKALNLAEFKKGMKETSISLSEAEMRMLFEHFDRDRSGSIDFEEFIQGVRDPLNDRRMKLVHMAFSVLDKDRSGFVNAVDVIDTYDASKHPEVIAGKKSANQVLEEFLDTFDVGGEKDGKVSRTEFENYYTNIGANIDNDDYFELMIRNAWHISGGEGWSANSANRRVLVTHADGRQTVEEIKDDLGLKADDKAGMMARLRAQGVNAANISLHDGMDNTTKAKSSKAYKSPTFSSQIKIG
jgi:Ca2+-binding EF-hand superfamily protein